MSKSPSSHGTSSDSGAAGHAAAQVGRGIAIAALLISLGNIASRILGQARETITAQLFGVEVDYSAYVIASTVPTTLYDFIVGGMVSAALVPVFSELAERDEHELGRVAGTIFTFATLLMTVMALLIWLVAPSIGTLLTLTTNSASLREQTIALIPWMLPATVFMAVAGLISGLLQARRRFLLPAFSTATFNAGIIVGAIGFSQVYGVASLAIGMSIGALGQMLLQLPGLRGIQLQIGLNLRHPDVRRIGKLYVPVLIGLSFSLVGITIDRSLASGVSEGAAAQMRYATTLIQLALGIVATAISLAALPTLSRQGTDPNNLTEYRRTLGLSIKAMLLLLLPVTTLMAALAYPIALLLFEGGETSAAAAGAIALALLCYTPSLIATGIDQPLIFAFYARRNTLLPNLVNGGAIIAYLLTAFLTVNVLGVYGLILGNVVQWWVHALLMLWFAHRRLDALRGQRLVEAGVKGLVASGAAGIIAWSLSEAVGGDGWGKWALLALVAGAGTIGLLVYVVVAHMLRIEALAVFGGALGRRLRR